MRESIIDLPRTITYNSLSQAANRDLITTMKKLIIFALAFSSIYLPSEIFAQDTAPASDDGQQKIETLKQLAAGLQQESQAIAQDQQELQQTEQAEQTTAKGGTSDIEDQAFANVINRQLPMTPEQIAILRKAFDDAQKAAATPPGVPPRPATTSILVSLSPGAAPPVIRLGAGYISSLVFVDSTGQPWPVKAYSVGDPTSFNIQWDKKSNTLLVQSGTFYKRSNLAVMLNGLDTPVMLTLLAGQTAVDYRVDLRIPGAGPNAVYTQQSLPSATNSILLNVLNGVPPEKARSLKIDGASSDVCQAWLFNDRLYLRTLLNVISPAWKSIMTSADGTHAYELQPTSVILAVHKGGDKTVRLVLEGLE